MLIKYTGKCVKIYFIIKITFLMVWWWFLMEKVEVLRRNAP